jgi:hypothetical protein
MNEQSLSGWERLCSFIAANLGFTNLGSVPCLGLQVLRHSG